MTQEELNKILENHKHWLNEDCDGWGSMRANLYEADLYEADLREAKLYEANLRGADLRVADLCESNLRGADLREANLYEADLRGANLYGAKLYEANLREANLRGADLREANLCESNLRGADLRKADLREANLRGANLYGADLRGAKNVPFIPYSCPDFGMFIGYKKASGYIVELEIPDDAKRLSATTRKCRCNKAKVLRILNTDRTIADITKVESSYDNSFIYKVGEVVSVDNFDEDRWNECSAGIHFFINFQEAVNY